MIIWSSRQFIKLVLAFLLLQMTTGLLGAPVSVVSAQEVPSETSHMLLNGNSPSNQSQIYADDRFGFKVSYPIDWGARLAFDYPNANDERITRKVTLSNIDHAIVNIDVWTNNAGLLVPAWIDRYEKALLYPNADIPTTSNIVISGIAGFFIVQPPFHDAPGRLISILQKDGLIFVIEYLIQDGGAAQSQYVQILSSFAFSDSSNPRYNLPQAPFLGDQVLVRAPLVQDCCGLHDSQYNPYPCSGGNCTWYAAYKRDDLPYNNENWGNAKDWITYARNDGLPTGQTPQVGAIVVFQPGVQGADPTYGHVAYVEQVYSSSSFRVTSQSWNGNCTISNYTAYTGNGVDFIYHSSGGGSPPSAPSSPNPGDGATVGRTNDTTFSWSTNGTSCDIHIWGGPSIDTTQTGISCSNFHWGSQWPGTYQWQVTAHNSYGTTGGPTWHLNIQPYAPTNLSASTASQTQINLSWTKSSDDPGSVDSYNIYRNGSKVGSASSGATSYNDGGLTCNQSYSYYVTAVRQSVESSASNTASASTQSCGSPPSAPSSPNPGDNATVGRTNDTTFSWSTNGTSCDIHIWGGPSIDTSQTGISCSSFHWGVQWPGAYQWQVTAHNSYGTTAGPTWHLSVRPYAPTGLTASAASQTQIKLSWTKSSDDPGSVDNYKVY